jgi:SAM-dependent methyltransferase
VSGRPSDAVIWHDVECAAYDLDLPFWRELADAAAGPVLDVGCGTGRVALELGRRGHEVAGVDPDADLVHELNARARKRSLPVKALAVDARSLDLGRRFALAIAPMQVIQLMGGAQGRRAVLAAVRRHLGDGAVFACALANPYEGMRDRDWVPPVPDMREEHGWVYASTPVSVRTRGESATIERHRQVVSPGGEVSEWMSTIELDLVTAAELEAEAAELGYTPRERGWIPESDQWTGSTVVILEAA